MAVRKTSERSGFQPYRDPVHAGSEQRLAKDGLGVEGGKVFEEVKIIRCALFFFFFFFPCSYIYIIVII